MSSPQNNITAPIMSDGSLQQSASAGSLPGTCESCGKATRSICTGCKLDQDEPDDQTRKTYYCSKDCQSSHWPQHKTTCKSHVDRIALYRAACIASQIFLNFCRKSWGRKVGSVTDEGKVLRVEIQELPQSTTYWPAPEMSDRPTTDLDSILSYSQCGNSMASMWDAVQLLFKAEDVEFDEVMAKVKDCRRETCFVIAGQERPAMNYVHLFWRLVHKKKKSYALDLTSHQFGHHEPLTLWGTYKVKLTFDILQTFPGGDEKERQLAEGSFKDRVAAQLLVRQGKATANAISTWEANNMTMRQLLRLPEAEFAQKSAELIELCEACVVRALNVDFEELMNEFQNISFY